MWVGFSSVSLFPAERVSTDLTMSRDNLRPSLVYTGNVEQYTALEQNIEVCAVSSQYAPRLIRLQAGIGQCQSLAQIQHLEVSLLPKPYKLHSLLNASLSKILEVLIEIRTLRLSIPRRETVLDVIPLRQDLVSCGSIGVPRCILTMHYYRSPRSTSLSSPSAMPRVLAPHYPSSSHRPVKL
jgi:hypothetical protein